MDGDISFSYGSKRAKQARLGKMLGTQSTYMIFIAIIAVLIAGGLLLVIGVKSNVGWLIASCTGPIWMLALWGRSLARLAPAKSNTVDAVLDSVILARLPREVSPQVAMKALRGNEGSNFIANRFVLSIEYLTDQLSADPGVMPAVWRQAEQYRTRYEFETINGAILTVALIVTQPGIDDYLAHLGIDKDDIAQGLSWFNHEEEIIAAYKARRPKGGIGRDWAFGYTPLLEHLGLNISEHITYGGSLAREVASRSQLADHVAHTIAQAGRRNVVLVGQLGSGKTKLVYNLAESLLEADPSVPKTLHYHQVIALDPSTLMSRARGRGELEELVQRVCYEALKAKNIILFLDDAQLFFEEGTGSVDLSNVLLPILDGGALRIILAMDEQRWTRITQNNPALAQNMNRVMVPPTGEKETMDIMENQVLKLEAQQKVVYTYQSLGAAYRLSSRFIAEQVMPGRALKLLEAAASFSDGMLVTQQSIEKAIEQTQGVKVGTADTATERDTLLNLENLIHQRMINQVRAVQVVSDALRRARAGVRNTNRPIGTFLFLGPTGVGKTELAKSVAAVFFGDENQLARLDLNEYVRSEDVARLIADASQDSHSLTAQISRQPFSVVLLDEIEKAHPEVLNTLLQVLDEGILRDINNREVSFRDAVIIATSNAGADRIRQHIEAGEKLEQFERQFTDELVSSNTFRPEFLNRFDDIVLFRPLEPAELLQVIDLILQGVNKTLAAQKLTIRVDDDAKQLLVQAGYDPRLGARPMRRIVQRTVENIVANQVLSQQIRPGGEVRITRADIEQSLART
jgi:ATP-dependent Clp protease ATP-binding subunit ClpC